MKDAQGRRWRAVRLDGGAMTIAARIWALRGADKRTEGPYRLSSGNTMDTLDGATLLARSLLAGFGLSGDAVRVHDAYGVECYIVEAV